jgi:hypothetical protein
LRFRLCGCSLRKPVAGLEGKHPSARRPAIEQAASKPQSTRFIESDLARRRA